MVTRDLWDAAACFVAAVPVSILAHAVAVDRNPR